MTKRAGKQNIEAFLPPAMIMHKTICVVAGLILPVLLIPVVRIFGFSEVFEEVAKVLVILFAILPIPGLRQKIVWTCVFALSFGVSESIFYLSEIIQSGDLGIFVLRLFTTMPMHIVTALIIFLFAQRGRKCLIIGVLIAIAIHLFYNFEILTLV